MTLWVPRPASRTCQRPPPWCDLWIVLFASRLQLCLGFLQALAKVFLLPLLLFVSCSIQHGAFCSEPTSNYQRQNIWDTLCTKLLQQVCLVVFLLAIHRLLKSTSLFLGLLWAQLFSFVLSWPCPLCFCNYQVDGGIGPQRRQAAAQIKLVRRANTQVW